MTSSYCARSEPTSTATIPPTDVGGVLGCFWSMMLENQDEALDRVITPLDSCFHAILRYPQWKLSHYGAATTPKGRNVEQVYPISHGWKGELISDRDGGWECYG